MQKLKVVPLAILALASAGTAVHAQNLAANFSASSFNPATDTLTDSVGGIVATAANGGTNMVGVNTTTGTEDVTTTGAGFTFNADSVTGLLGSTTYTIAIGFSYAGGAGGGADAYEGEGAFGGDLPGPGDGDANLGVTSDGGGQLIGSVGSTDGNDQNVYDTSGNTFSTTANNGAVLVVNGNTLTLYVNGAPTTQGSPITLANGTTFTPFGHLANGTVTTNYNFGIGTNTNGTNGAQPLNGTISDAQIYTGALTTAQAEALSTSLENGSSAAVPEPSTWALLVGGLAAFLGLSMFRRKTA